jgi:predicted P-loop ATPase
MTAFVSTVNFLEFLRDVTGARRYLVLHVLRHLPNPNDVVDMQQLFAQVYLAWLEYGETHNLLPKEEAIRRSQEETYTESTEAEDRMTDYFGKLIKEVPRHDWLPLTWTEICEVAQLPRDRRHTSEVSEWLRKQGIERLPSKADQRTRVYPAQKRMCWYVPLRPNDFVRYAADGVQPKTMLKLVKGGKA